jgi:ParB-like nuclease domain
MRIHGGGHTMAEWKAALKGAERDLVRPGLDDEKVVRLTISEIETLPALFQPREIPNGPLGALSADKKYTKQLQREIDKVGELDPIVVIKLRRHLEDPYADEATLTEQWTVVDGHHRLEAYRKEKWKEPIECEWFSGTVREAADISVKHNSKLKWSMSPGDKQEAAWKRVLLSDCSKKEISKVCGVGREMVRFMRSVRAVYYDTTDRSGFRKRLRKEIGDIERCPWTFARLAFLNQDKTERTAEMKAQTLAKVLRSKMEGRLSEDAKVTAMALAAYDPELPRQLAKAFGKLEHNEDDEDGDALLARDAGAVDAIRREEESEETLALRRTQSSLRAEGLRPESTPEWTGTNAPGRGRTPLPTSEGGRRDHLIH